MSQSDLESQLEQLRQTGETTRRQLEATPGLTADMVEAMLALLVQQIAALEERIGSTQYDQRQQQVGQQIIVQGDYHAAAPETTLDDPTALARYLDHTLNLWYLKVEWGVQRSLAPLSGRAPREMDVARAHGSQPPSMGQRLEQQINT